MKIVAIYKSGKRQIYNIERNCAIVDGVIFDIQSALEFLKQNNSIQYVALQKDLNDW